MTQKIYIEENIFLCFFSRLSQFSRFAPNLSSGKLLSFISLSKKILKILGKKNIKINGNSNKPEGVYARGGSTFLQKKYGFVPKISIDQGIKWAIQYFDNKQ